MEMPDRLSPVNVALIGDEMAIAWNDGRESYIPLQLLRRSCPCAACCGEPDALGNVVKPEVHHTRESFELRGWQIIGGYALQPAWGDGHSTGLYTFPYLRTIAGTG
jgi:DUF971 family protein